MYLGQGFRASWALNFSSRLNMFFAMSDGQAVPRRHDVEETILFSLALSFHGYPGLSGFRAVPLQVRGGERGALLRGRPPCHFGGVWAPNWFQKGIQKINRKTISKKSVSGEVQGRPREAQEAPRRPNGSQKAPKRLPKSSQNRRF